MAEFTNLSKIMEEKKKEEAKEVKFGEESVPAQEKPPVDFSFDDNDAEVKTNQGSGFTFPNGVGSRLSREQLEELKQQAIDTSNNGTGPKKL